MNIQRFHAYEQLIEREGKACLTQLISWTASNKFLTLKYLNEIIKKGLIIKSGSYYKLNKEAVEQWYLN